MVGKFFDHRTIKSFVFFHHNRPRIFGIASDWELSEIEEVDLEFNWRSDDAIYEFALLLYDDGHVFLQINRNPSPLGESRTLLIEFKEINDTSLLEFDKIIASPPFSDQVNIEDVDHSG